MRLRVGAVLCLFLAFCGIGCRKSLVPTTLDNQAPETWIVAAPQDTITTRDSFGQPIRPQIGKIPVRFHMYWAGSDVDGTVTGFYWAVVETLPVPQEGAASVPSLPGPKARDYHFTTKTDSLFIFSASEEVSERQHAFYIYAVDDKGRPDPTPARFVFSSYDRFPPLAVIDECRADGFEYQLNPGGGGVTQVPKTYFVTDFFEISNTHAFPRDTVSSGSVLHMKWHGVPTIPSTVVTGYRYKLDEPTFNTVDSSVHVTAYDTGVGTDKVNPGQKIFTLRAIGQSGWRGESTRWFRMNFAPDTWFAGPDPNDAAAGWQTNVDGNGKHYYFHDFGTTGWASFQGVPGTPLSADSVNLLPAQRVERRAFFEVWEDRLWLRQEEDTVHMNSWVIIPSGGFDRDSPYAVKVNTPLLPDDLKGKLTLTPTGPNGSPIGFRIRVQVKDRSGQITQPSETTTYPVFDPASVFHQPVINGFQGLNTAGRAYAVVRAEDGDGTVDRRIDQQPGDAVGVADRVDAGGGTPRDKQLRSKILTFYVNHAPQLLTKQLGFSPKPGQPFLSRSVSLNPIADDDDGFDPTKFNAVGGRADRSLRILRWKVAVLGKQPGTGRDTCYIVPGEFNQTPNTVSFNLPQEAIAPGPITFRIRLCDCAQCDALPGTPTCPFAGHEASPGQGTCVDTDIPAVLQVNPAPNGAVGAAGGTPPPPGSATGPGRRDR